MIIKFEDTVLQPTSSNMKLQFKTENIFDHTGLFYVTNNFDEGGQWSYSWWNPLN